MLGDNQRELERELEMEISLDSQSRPLTTSVQEARYYVENMDYSITNYFDDKTSDMVSAHYLLADLASEIQTLQKKLQLKLKERGVGKIGGYNG